MIVPSRGRPIRNLDRDYPDIAVLTVQAPGGHPCVRMDLVRPHYGDHVVVFGYPEEGGSVHLTPAGLTYRGLHGTSPRSFWDLGADTVKPGMSGAAALHLRTGGIGGILVASKNPARADGALAVPWHEVDGDLAAVLAANRRFHEADHRWNDAAWDDRAGTAVTGLARRVDEVDLDDLRLHATIPLRRAAGQALNLSQFPEYFTRRVDADLRSWIGGRVKEGKGGFIVLEGNAATGKTRCMYEALRAEIPKWRMPDVRTGADLNEMVRRESRMPRTVLWLDDLQNFFTGEPLTDKTVAILQSGSLGPVLLAGTVRADEFEKLQETGDFDKERDAAQREAAVIFKGWPRWSAESGVQGPRVVFNLKVKLEEEELADARRVAVEDPRLAGALRLAEDGNVIGTLAGAPPLIARWANDNGDLHGRAIITAAITARRCGHPETVPQAVLEALALAQLAVTSRAPKKHAWARAAIEWAERPVTGDVAPLRRAATRLGAADGYRVSDILVQNSRERTCQIVQPLLDDDGTWTLVLENTATAVWTDIGVAANSEGKKEVAERAWGAAAEDGETRAMRNLGWLLFDRGESAAVRHWFLRAIDLGDVDAMRGFSYVLERFGEWPESIRWTREAAEHGDPPAMVNFGIRLQGMRQFDEAASWFQRAADLGNSVAMNNLGYLLEHRRGDSSGAEIWYRSAAELGQPGAMVNLAIICKGRGQLVDAHFWYRKAAEFAVARIRARPNIFHPWPGEARDEGVSDAIRGLGELLAEMGNTSNAELLLRAIADRGDARAAAALAGLYQTRGDLTGAQSWRQKAAALAHANFIRNKRSLLAAYGEEGVIRHVDIMKEYAADLAAHGYTAKAAEWHDRAAAHRPSPPPGEGPGSD